MQHSEGNKTFNHERLAVNLPHYDRVGSIRRADGRTEVIFARGSYLRRQWNDDTGPSSGGENASYRESPWRLRKEDFIEFEKAQQQ